MADKYWDREKLADLRAAVAEGGSALEIAARMSARLGRKFTKNSIISIMHRKKIPLPGNRLAGVPQQKRESYHQRWTPTEIKLLKEAAVTGLSRKAAAEIVGRTEYAVETIAARRGIQFHGNMVIEPLTAPADPIMADVPDTVEAVLALRLTSCRYPIGEPAQPGFRFCGCDTGSLDRPYCEEHAKRCWTAPPKPGKGHPRTRAYFPTGAKHENRAGSAGKSSNRIDPWHKPRTSLAPRGNR